MMRARKVPTKDILKNVDQALAKIRSLADSDPEAAHGERDRLYIYALTIIAADSGISVGPFGAREIARRAKSAREIPLRFEATA